MAGRAVGWALLAYGVAGIALVVVGAVGGLGMAGRVEAMALDAESTLEAAERAATATAESFEAVDDTLTEARASAEGAASLARDASATLQGLSLAMSINILGAQPLLPLAREFAESAEQAAELGDTLDEVGASFSRTRTDMARIAIELDSLAAELSGLRESSTVDGEPPPIRLFVMMVLLWLALQAIGAIIAGLAFLRRWPRSAAVAAAPVEPS